MKFISTFAVVVALMLATATAALASHGAKNLSAPVPAHGSIWMGEGLERYDTVQFPAHGSVWFGEGLGELVQR